MNGYNDEIPSGGAIFCVAIIILLAIGFAGGYAWRCLQQPAISKREEKDIMELAIKQTQAAAYSRALADVVCGKCHGEN